MTVPLPVTLPATASWGLVDWIDRSYNAVAGSDGVALITLDPLPDNQRWELTHVVIGCTTNPSLAPTMRLYIDSVSNSGLRDGSSTGAFDVADWARGLKVAPSRQLLARWTGCNPGDTAFMNLQADVLQRSS